MQVLAQLGLGSNGVDELMAGILGVAGHKPDVVVSGHGAQQVQQVGEVDLFFQTFAVAVDVLSQKGDLLVASFHQPPELCQNVPGFAAFFPSPDIGHDAVCAEVIAAIHDGQPGTELTFPPDGDILHDDRTLCRVQQHPLVLLEFLGNELGQGVDPVHAKDQIHIGVALSELFHHMLLVCHAAAQTDDQPRLFLLEPF